MDASAIIWPVALRCPRAIHLPCARSDIGVGLLTMARFPLKSILLHAALFYAQEMRDTAALNYNHDL